MLYGAYQAYDDALTPIRLMAEASFGMLDRSWPVFGNPPLLRRAVAALELISHAGLKHERPAFGIDAVTIAGERVPVTEEVVASDPFCNLVHFRKEGARDEPTVLVVAPLSGHFSTLLRGTVATLLPDHNVFLTDWTNARDVPLLHGRFGFDDYVDLVIRFVRLLGPHLHA
ncbi:MAG: polyhydroxyalkanoate depolymerase, partial [Stellaceae bacterium]